MPWFAGSYVCVSFLAKGDWEGTAADLGIRRKARYVAQSQHHCENVSTHCIQMAVRD